MVTVSVLVTYAFINISHPLSPQWHPATVLHSLKTLRRRPHLDAMTRPTTISAGLSREEKDMISLLPIEMLLEINRKIEAVGDLRSLALSSKLFSTTAGRSLIERDPQRALMHFTARNNVKGMEKALYAGANVDFLYEPIGDKRSKLLSEHELRGIREYRPLHIAAIKGNIAAAKYLLEQGATVDAEIGDRITAFWLAATDGSMSMMRFLASHGSDIDRVDNFGSSLLHHFSLVKEKKIVQCLLDLGADIHARERGRDLDTALGKAALVGEADICHMLIEKGSDVNHQNRFGWTPLHMAAKEGHGQTVRYLLDNGADVGRTEETGCTALLFGALFRRTSVCCLLHSHGGSDINHANSRGDTALHMAADSADFQLTRYLLEHNADVRKQNFNGDTALGLAAENAGRACLPLSRSDRALFGHVHQDARRCRQIFKLLQEKGSDVDHQNNGGHTPLQLYDRAQQEWRVYVDGLRAHEREKNRRICSIM